MVFNGEVVFSNICPLSNFSPLCSFLLVQMPPEGGLDFVYVIEIFPLFYHLPSTDLIRICYIIFAKTTSLLKKVFFILLEQEAQFHEMKVLFHKLFVTTMFS
jgi:hypothetical protein